MSYNLYLDDYREPMGSFDEKHDQVYLLSWVVVRSYDEFIKTIIEKGMPEMISFDHDLADEHNDFHKPYGDYKEKTGFHCAKWLIYYCIDNKLELPAVILIHSANPAGSANIKSLFDTYEKYRRL